MSVKIINDSNKEFKPYKLPVYSSSVMGTSEYELRSFSFDEDVAVQENFDYDTDKEPDAIFTIEDEVTDDMYLPPSRIAKAADGPVGEKLILTDSSTVTGASSSDSFVESEFFSDSDEEEPDFPNKVVTSSQADDKTQQAPTSDEDKAKIEELEKLVKSKEEEVEKVRLELNEKMEKAVADAKDETRTIVEKEVSSQYEANKEDYMAQINTFNSESLDELKNISASVVGVDEKVADIVVGFVSSIIGAERKINDEFAVNLIKLNLSRLVNLQDISFSVNPDDLESVKEAFPDYVVSTDTSISKGAVKVNTRVGDVDLNTDKMIEDLKKQIDEECISDKKD